MAFTDFRIRVYKRLAGDPNAKEWSNDYDIQVGAAIAVKDPSLDAIVASIVNFEKSIHGWEVNFKRAVISSTVENDLPASEASRTVGLSISGGRQGNNFSNKILELSQVLPLMFSGGGGRNARHVYRGVLDTENTTNAGGGLILKPQFTQEVADAVTALLASPAGPLLRIATAEGAVVASRDVDGITVGLPANRQRTARRKPKISYEPNALAVRLANATKEVSLIDASFGYARALGTINIAGNAKLVAAIAALKEAAASLDAA